MSTSTEPKHLQVARGELGVRERIGTADNPRIVQYHASTRLRATSDEVPWCASFVCWVLESCGIASTRSAAAASYRTWGVRCNLRVGAVVVFGKSDPDAAGTGHVGFVVRWDAEHVWVLGGNQGNAVTIAKRPRAGIVAVRWPAGLV